MYLTLLQPSKWDSFIPPFLLAINSGINKLWLKCVQNKNLQALATIDSRETAPSCSSFNDELPRHAIIGHIMGNFFSS